MKKCLFLAAVAVVALATSVATQAATVSVAIELNPAAPGCVGCTLSGAGTYNVFATASADDNEGIAGYGISIQNVSTLLHRAPRVNSSETPDGDIFPAGFTLLRSANHAVANGTGFLMGAGQDTVSPTPYIVNGFGQTAGDFASLLPADNTNGGIIQPSWSGKLLLAEGAYDVNGAAPFIDFSNVDVFANVFSGSGIIRADLNGGAVVDPPVVTDFHDPTDLLNKVVNHTLDVTNTPVDWSGLDFISYTPGFGATNPVGAGLAPTWDPVTGTFNWDTSGSTRGTYVWNATATNDGGSDVGVISVDVTQVPEPATFALLGLALVGFAGFRRK